MTAILQIEASARIRGSLSRQLARDFRAAWQAREPEARFIHRDVGQAPPPFVTEDWIGAAFTPESKRTAEQRALLRTSDELIEEIELADVIVIATPMYNYGMPASLKGWFDQVIRVNRTFSFDLSRGDWPLKPMLSAKTLVMLTAKGEFGFEPGGIRADMNHLEPHIRTCAHYLGAERVHEITIEYQELGDDRHERSKDSAHAAVRQLVAELTAGIDSRVDSHAARIPTVEAHPEEHEDSH